MRSHASVPYMHLVHVGLKTAAGRNLKLRDGSKEIDAPQAERLGRSCLSIVPRSRSHARLRRNTTMSHAFPCVQPGFIDL
ncbi:hypothetical protein EVAR_48024_1 [Eumeta japonica]|uniref:Uncharacterized protein n=1 Tax=Eumeta variegata TaxID=151549 RepID=A0A4C1XPA3_EUMVA|nr:hypothetical protein EVAR_48024_1 [Eumeta japonica]